MIRVAWYLGFILCDHDGLMLKFSLSTSVISMGSVVWVSIWSGQEWRVCTVRWGILTRPIFYNDEVLADRVIIHGNNVG